jgi:hypothetical protein
MAQHRSSSAQSNGSRKPFGHIVPRIIRSPEVHPMSIITAGLSSRESSASIQIVRNAFTYMIMMNSERNTENESIFQTIDETYSGQNTSIERVVSRIIYKNMKTDGTKSLLMKIALVLKRRSTRKPKISVYIETSMSTDFGFDLIES